MGSFLMVGIPRILFAPSAIIWSYFHHIGFLPNLKNAHKIRKKTHIAKQNRVNKLQLKTLMLEDKNTCFRCTISWTFWNTHHTSYWSRINFVTEVDDLGFRIQAAQSVQTKTMRTPLDLHRLIARTVTLTFFRI